MIQIKLKKLEDLKEQGADVDLVSFHLYTSIYESVPKLTFTYKSSYLTPDALGLFIGSSFPLQYVINLNDEISDPVSFTGFCVKDIPLVQAGPGTVETRVECVGDIQYFQKTDIRRAYKNKYGNEIIKDIFDSNSNLKSKEQNVLDTNNVTTLYRTLGDSDFDFINNQILKSYTISLGKPLFFLGLNDVLNFTSINAITNNSDNVDTIIRWPSTNDDNGEKFIKKMLKNFAKDEAVILKAFEPKMYIGADDSALNIKNSIFYTDLTGDTISTSAYKLKPGATEKNYYPVDKLFLSFVDTSQVTPIFNRPASNIVYEASGLFEGLDKLIQMDLEIQDSKDLDHLILAGDRVVVITSYAFSVYNGIYTVVAAEYGQDQAAFFMKLKLMRTFIDLTWTEELQQLKNQEDFKYPFAPPVQKSLLYSV